MSGIGLVLSGGGARGAYEAGVLVGLAEALGRERTTRPLFPVVAGTSVGAINGAWVVANAHRPAHSVHELAAVWRGLKLKEHLRVDLMGLIGFTSPWRFMRKAALSQGDVAERLGRSILDPRALELLVARSVEWPMVHANVASGLVRAFLVSALHVGTGVTTTFHELSPGARFVPTRDARRFARQEPIEAGHVLASAAIPALFPARRVGTGYFVDGGLRFNTPIAPAIRSGASRLVVVSLRHEAPVPPDLDQPGVTEQYPHPVFLLGKLLNALLLDPVIYDVQVLDRFNQVLHVLDHVLTEDEKRRFDEVVVASRGMPYRELATLRFEPSENIGVLAGRHLRDHLGTWKVGRFYEWLLARAADDDATWEADLASYLLFDGSWADTLIELGRSDALARREEIRDFFAATDVW